MPRFANLAEILDRLGGIDPKRVRAWPLPGRATVKDLIAILDHENVPCELIDGILVEKVMGLIESRLAVRLGRYVDGFVEEHDLGFVLGADGALKLMKGLVRVPDVSFVSWDQYPARELPREAVPELYPDLAIEVLSESNTKAEMDQKLKDYFFAGTRLVWYVDPDRRTVTVYTAPDASTVLTEAATLTGGDVLPGFSLPLKQLFARVPKNGKRSPRRRR
jgi:Uma2 family endonuclease